MTEFEKLKKEATDLGITFSPNIGEDTLLAKVTTFKEAQEHEKTEPELIVPVVEYKAPESAAAKAQRMRKEANKLVRIVATCMNPNKKAMSGEFFSVSNAIVGTVKKYVHFDSEEGWHVPAIIVDHLREDRKSVV